MKLKFRSWGLGLQIALAIALALFAAPAFAQDAPAPVQLPPRAAPTRHIAVSELPVLGLHKPPPFDAQRATAAYLQRIGGAARARSDAYFEGGYVLQAVDLGFTLVIMGLLLWLGISAAIRDWAQDQTRSRIGQILIYVATYLVIVTVAEFPLALYEGYFREHAYGLSNQTLLAWLRDYAIQFLLSFVAGLVMLPILYAAIRKAREAWWIWGAAIAITFQILVMAIYPVFIAPLFNNYTALPNGPLRQQIQSLARANDIPAATIWVEDASRQSNRISAHVAGFLGTTRIVLNDNLLKDGSPDEVLAVLGHEMGHYVMDHTTRLLLLLGLMTILGFAFANWGFLIAIDLFGGNWHVRRIEDIAGLPLLAALGAIFLFFATPVANTVVRTTEYQADIFGLNAVRKPDAFATAMLKLSAYRKLDPGKWEEILFYDHPSGRVRIMTAMRWKQEHIHDADVQGTVSPQ